MTEQEIIDEIKLSLTGYLPELELEVEDKTLATIVKKAMRELNRYWDESTLVTVPYASCIDLAAESGKFTEQVSSIVKVYRTQGLGDSTTASSGSLIDPVFAQQFLLFSNGATMYNLNDYILNYASWITVNQIKNTMSTDLAFKEDKHNHKLYINNYQAPSFVTIEYIPVIQKAEDIKSDYWIDILIRLATAMTKVVLGRIRTRFTQTGALWTQDGDKMLEEGNNELKELRERLNLNSQLIYGVD